MERRRFGATDLAVSALGFGGSEIRSEAEPQRVQRLLEGALDAGLNVLDTSACYGRSEELIGSAVSHRRHDFYLFTKCGHASGLETPDWTAETVRHSIERSLRRLKTDYVDLIQLHTCGIEVLEQGDVIEELETARRAGKVRYIGYSGDNAPARWAVESGRFDTLQTSCNIADQSVLDEIIPRAHARNMGIIAKRPLANVAWRMERLPEDDYGYVYGLRLKELQFPLTREPLHDAVGTALRFTLSVPGVATAIVGTRKPGRWQENADHVARGPLAMGRYEEIRNCWKKTADESWTAES